MLEGEIREARQQLEVLRLRQATHANSAGPGAGAAGDVASAAVAVGGDRSEAVLKLELDRKARAALLFSMRGSALISVVVIIVVFCFVVVVGVV